MSLPLLLQVLGGGPSLSPAMQEVQAHSVAPIPTEMQLDVGIGRPGAMSIQGPAASQLLDQQNARAAHAAHTMMPGHPVSTLDPSNPTAEFGLEHSLARDEYGTHQSIVATTGEDGLPEFSTDRMIGAESPMPSRTAFDELDSYDEDEGKEHKHRIRQGLKKLIPGLHSKAGS